MTLTLQNFLDRIKNAQPVSFNNTMQIINENYDYQATGFSNGVGDQIVINDAGKNEGSCKIFSFALLNGLNQSETLSLFGDYYRKDVLENPEGTDHQNIRNFMLFGWDGIHFNGQALRAK